MAEINVRNVIHEIRKRSPVLRDLETQGTIQIVGAMYDLKTGKVTFHKE